MSLTPVRHLVRIKAFRRWDLDPVTKKLINPRLEPVAAGRIWEGAGGSRQEDMQKAQVFGWSRRAQEYLNTRRNDPECYEVLPVFLVLGTPHP